MEYVIVRATHPSWLTMNLPSEIAELLGFDTGGEGSPPGSRAIAFLSRAPGIVRVVATYPAREALAVETVRSRLIATARVTDRRLFSLPAQVAHHLGLTVAPRTGRLRGTADTVVWFLPAPEYYAFRGSEDRERGSGAKGTFAHVYLAKSLVPFPREVGQLAETDARIEAEEWRPGVEALQRVFRGRRSGS